MKTSELQGAALDWAVAEALGTVHKNEEGQYHSWWPSTDWAQGGPIIERKRIHLAHSHAKGHWVAAIADSDCGNVFGPTPLVAAMRCYVASKLGDEVVLPEELK